MCTQCRVWYVDHSASLISQSGRLSFQPLTFHLEPPDLFVEFCLLGLLFTLIVRAVTGEDTGTVFQQLPSPSPNQAGMNLKLIL